MAGAEADARSVLRLFVLARCMSFMADATVAFVVPVLVYQLTHSASMSGLALAVEYTPKIVLVPFLGARSQRFRLRPQFWTVEAVRVALCLALVLAPKVWIIMLLSASVAVAGSHAYLLNESLVAFTFTGRDRTVAQARLQTSDQLSRVVGPAVGAAVFAVVGAHAILLGALVLYATCALVLFWLPASADRPGKAPSKDSKSGVRRGYAIFRASPDLMRLTALLCATNFAAGVMLAIAPATIVQSFHLPTSRFGVVAAVAAFVTAGSMMVVGRRKSKTSVPAHGADPALGRRALAVCLAALVIIVAAPDFYVFTIGYAIYFAANVAYATYQRVERLRHIPQDGVGETIGLMTALFWSSVPLSGLVVGALAGTLGLRPTTGVVALVTAACVLWLGRGLPRSERAPAVTAPTETIKL
ncbi:MAG TPA: MFS transporter [Actinospica sp.]|jgi:MFS family permease|nr:MFS transporter [Actinospica sp.]